MYESRPIKNRASEDRRSAVSRDCERVRREHQLEDFFLLHSLARVFHALHQLHIHILSIETLSCTASNTLADTSATVRDATPDTTPRQVWCQVEARRRRRCHWNTNKAETVGWDSSQYQVKLTLGIGYANRRHPGNLHYYALNGHIYTKLSLNLTRPAGTLLRILDPRTSHRWFLTSTPLYAKLILRPQPLHLHRAPGALLIVAYNDIWRTDLKRDT